MNSWVLLQLGVSGILVLDARKGGPAWKSGIKGTSRDEFGRLVIGDVITAFKGMPIKCAVRYLCTCLWHVSGPDLSSCLPCARSPPRVNRLALGFDVR